MTSESDVTMEYKSDDVDGRVAATTASTSNDDSKLRPSKFAASGLRTLKRTVAVAEGERDTGGRAHSAKGYAVKVTAEEGLPGSAVIEDVTPTHVDGSQRIHEPGKPHRQTREVILDAVGVKRKTR